MKFIRIVGHVFCQRVNHDVFRWFAGKNLSILFPHAKHDINNSVSLNVFASKVATSAVIVGHSSYDLDFLTVLLERQYRHFRLCENLKHFSVFSS